MRKILLLGVLLLSGCTVQNPFIKSETMTPEMRWQARLTEQASMEKWSFKGRTAIVQGRKGWNASIKWIHQSEKDYQLKLSGPFAQGGALLTGTTEHVSLELDNGEQYIAETPEQLFSEVFGWQLPVSALQDWVRGIPTQGFAVEAQQLDELGRLTELEQAGWTIAFHRYIPFENTTMPAKIFMQHPDLSIRIVIADWDRPE
jgi:outer membrane lipoprotein LolB